MGGWRKGQRGGEEGRGGSRSPQDGGPPLDTSQPKPQAPGPPPPPCPWPWLPAPGMTSRQLPFLEPGAKHQTEEAGFRGGAVRVCPTPLVRLRRRTSRLSEWL